MKLIHFLKCLNRTIIVLLLYTIVPSLYAQMEIPAVYSNIKYDSAGRLCFINPDTQMKYYLRDPEKVYQLPMIEKSLSGSAKGIAFDFGRPGLSGKICYGFIDMGKARIPQPVFFWNDAPVSEGKAEINITEMSGKYDLVKWELFGRLKMGYRIIDGDGTIIYDGKVNMKGKGPFETDVSITEGPFLNVLTPKSVIISFKTNQPVILSVEVNGMEFSDDQPVVDHEIQVTGLQPGTKYDYTVFCGDNAETYSFRTAPFPGSRKPFTFAYASDSRAGQGGGERNIYGTNAYMIKKLGALALQQGAAFFQFTGDLINGYSDDVEKTRLEYANWKRAVEPFAHYIPFVVGMGNHEAINYIFDNETGRDIYIDRFPFATGSSEALFAENVVNPLSGLKSEDRSECDPDKNNMDFPAYEESVFCYTYGNIAMIVMNSNYWYAPTADLVRYTGGNIHGYIMDNQLGWLKKTLKKLEKDNNIDHVFVTIHTPAFPNGGHAADDMWYSGNNDYRPYIAGEPVKKGIIERRDEFLDLMINHSTKAIALLCGDEHNYCRMKLMPSTRIYPPEWSHRKLVISRPFWQITNGSAGAPYYGQERFPWSKAVKAFSTQYALCLFHIDGRKVTLEVINPDTLEIIEKVELNSD